jgi:multidrug efflux pump subunit AcrB
VELPGTELTADFLERTLIRTASGEYVPLADVVTVQSRTGFSTVQRENGILLVTVTGDLDDEDADRANQIRDQINDTILQNVQQSFGVETYLSGLSEQEAAFLADARKSLIIVLCGIFLSLAWIFGSWTRPFVVMAVIPFGFVGTIYGHNLWDIPMSMFTIVGLIGMVGIVINDSIVLVTTVDEYAKDRGLIPAIIDGTTDRLRPVLLTTLTTVFGLAPLLYEGSNQAEFLKPTIVTLVYGLGFGMVIVLLVVPSLIAMQDDFGRNVQAARRALRSRNRAAFLPAAIAAAAGVALFGVILAPVILAGDGGVGAAFGRFAAGMAASVLAIYIVSALIVARKQVA